MRRIVTRSAVAIVLVMMSIVALASCTQEANLAESEELLTPTEEPQSETPSTAAPQPESTTPANGLTFEFVSVTIPAKIKGTITIIGKTSPGAECKLVMTLANGDVSGFPKDPVKDADDDGNVKWEWELFRFTPAGETKLEVTASLGGSSTTTTTSFTAEK